MRKGGGGGLGSLDRSQESMRQPILFVLAIAIIVSIILPLIFPHIAHTSTTYHIALHSVSVGIAIFLSMIAIIAYKRSGGAKILLMTLGFLVLSISEILYFVDATRITPLPEVPVLNAEVPHMVLFAMLMLFGLSVLRTEAHQL